MKITVERQTDSLRFDCVVMSTAVTGPTDLWGMLSEIVALTDFHEMGVVREAMQSEFDWDAGERFKKYLDLPQNADFKAQLIEWAQTIT